MNKRLNKALKRKGLTQIELAHMLNITPQSLNARLKNPTYNSIVEISKAIDCSICELVDESQKIQLIIDDELHVFYSLKELDKFLEIKKGSV